MFSMETVLEVLKPIITRAYGKDEFEYRDKLVKIYFFQNSDYQGFVEGIQKNNVSIICSSTYANFPVRFFLEKIKSVVAEKKDFENRENFSLLANFVNFGLSGFP